MRNSTNGWKTRSMAFVAAVLILAIPLLTISMARNTEAASTFADFNGDGYRDLAIGVPQEDVGSEADAGAVNVVYGSSTGLSAIAGPGGQFWHQDSSGIPEIAAADDNFGESLTVGDFNNDGYYDLAIGVPEEDFLDLSDNEIIWIGAVNILYGSSSYLSPTSVADQLWQPDSTDIEETGEPQDRFGDALASG